MSTMYRRAELFNVFRASCVVDTLSCCVAFRSSRRKPMKRENRDHLVHALNSALVECVTALETQNRGLDSLCQSLCAINWHACQSHASVDDIIGTNRMFQHGFLVASAKSHPKVLGFLRDTATERLERV